MALYKQYSDQCIPRITQITVCKLRKERCRCFLTAVRALVTLLRCAALLAQGAMIELVFCTPHGLLSISVNCDFLSFFCTYR